MIDYTYLSSFDNVKIFSLSLKIPFEFTMRNGTIGAPLMVEAFRLPFLNSPMTPVLDRVPSGKMAMETPLLISSIAARTVLRPSLRFSLSRKKPCVHRIHQESRGIFSNSFLAMKPVRAGK